MRRAAWLIVPIVVLALLTAAVFATRPPSGSTAFTLHAGDCFDLPTDANVGDIATMPCDSPHDAEAFVTASLADPAATGYVAYPGEGAIAAWVGDQCGASAEAAWAGWAATRRADLVVGYFFPTADAWTHGERQVTCYLHSKLAKLSAPLRAPGGGAASPSASASRARSASPAAPAAS